MRPMEFDEGYEQRRPLYQLSTLLWRMAGFEAVFDDKSGLAAARAEAQSASSSSGSSRSYRRIGRRAVGRVDKLPLGLPVECRPCAG